MSPLPKQTEEDFSRKSHRVWLRRRRTLSERERKREKFGGSGRNERVPRLPFLDTSYLSRIRWWILGICWNSRWIFFIFIGINKNFLINIIRLKSWSNLLCIVATRISIYLEQFYVTRLPVSICEYCSLLDRSETNPTLFSKPVKGKQRAHLGNTRNLITNLFHCVTGWNFDRLLILSWAATWSRKA